LYNYVEVSLQKYIYMSENKTNIPKLLTIRQAAEILNVHVETLRRWDKSGKLKAIVISNRGDRRYEMKDIQNIIKNKNK